MSEKSVKLSEIILKVKEIGLCKMHELPPIDIDREIKILNTAVENITDILKQLSEPSKFKILLLLHLNNLLPVCVISYILNLDQTLTSHHLRTLMKAGLVEYKRVGKYKLYKLTDNADRLLTAILNTLTYSKT